MRKTINHRDVKGWLAEAMSEIDACASLEQDWDGENSVPATLEAAEAAKDIIRSIADSAIAGSPARGRPSIGAMGDGGIVLSWAADGRQAMLVVGQDRSRGIVCVTEIPGQPPIREVESVGDAAQKVVAILYAR